MQDRLFSPRRGAAVTAFFALVACFALVAVSALPAFAGDDSSPDAVPEVVFPPGVQAGEPADLPLPTERQIVFFTPQDENTSVTVMFFTNTTNANRTVRITTYRLDGSVFIDTTINVPARGLVRIAADPVSTISASWQDTILVNFTTFSAYGRLVLPRGVFAEGYVAWNGGATYDPLDVVPTLPLRFWTR